MAGSVIVGLVLAYFVATASAACNSNQYTCASVSPSGTACAALGNCVTSTGCYNLGFYTTSASQCVSSCPSGSYGLTLTSPNSKTCGTAANCLHSSLFGNPSTGTCTATCPSNYYGDSYNGNCVTPPVCPTTSPDSVPYVDANNICQSAASCTTNHNYVDVYSNTCLTYSACTSTLDSNGLALTAVNGTQNSCQCPPSKPYAYNPSSLLTCTTPATCLAFSSPNAVPPSYYFADPNSNDCTLVCTPLNGVQQWGDVVEGICVSQTACQSAGRFTDRGSGWCVPATLCPGGYGDPTSNNCVPSCTSVVGYPYVNETSNICSPTAPPINVLYYNVSYFVSQDDFFTQTPNTERDCLKLDGVDTFTPGYTLVSANTGDTICCSEIGLYQSSMNPNCQQVKCTNFVSVDGYSLDDPTTSPPTDGSFCFGNCYQNALPPNSNYQYNTLNNGNNPLYFNSVVAATSVSSPKAGYAVTNRNGLNSGWVITTTGSRRGVEHVASGSYLCLIKGAVSGGNCEYTVCGSQATETPSQGYFSYTPNGSNTEECYLRCYGH